MHQHELVPGKLRIVKRIGAGGMGAVYEALQLHLARRVAVKVIQPLIVGSPEARARFLREARALAALSSEHIVQVLDVDTLAGGGLYMVMEYLEGRDLRRELQKRGPLPVPEAAGYLIQACAGVAAAHSAGIVHRDIKPANIFITNLNGARCVKILDFGVAKFESSPDQFLTGPTHQVGTPTYMAPEQFSGAEADPRSDVWALGVVLCEILTGRPPFRRATSALTSFAVLTEPAPSPCEERSDVPPALGQVVARCLEKAPSARFANASELAAALAPFGPRRPTVRASQRVSRGSSDALPVAPALTPLSLELLATQVASASQQSANVHELVLPDSPPRQEPPAASTVGPHPQQGPAHAEPVATVLEVPVSPTERAFRVSAAPPGVPPKVRWRLAAALVAGLLVVGLAGKAVSSRSLESKLGSSSRARPYDTATVPRSAGPSPAASMQQPYVEPEPAPLPLQSQRPVGGPSALRGVVRQRSLSTPPPKPSPTPRAHASGRAAVPRATVPLHL